MSYKEKEAVVVGESALIEMYAECPRCDNVDNYEIDGVPYLNNLFGSFGDHTCTECGFHYSNEETYYFDDEGNQITEYEYFDYMDNEEE